MTKKHFIAAADYIKHEVADADRARCAKHFAAFFKTTNPRFDADRFYRACSL